MDANAIISRASDVIKEVKGNLKKKHLHKIAAKNVDFAVEVNKCIGELGFCLDEYARTIRDQSINVKIGKAEGFNTVVQEEQVKTCAKGYLIVREALFTLKSLRNYDSFEMAQDMLDNAALFMSGKKESIISKLSKLRKKYPDYSGFFSEESDQRKNQIVDNILKDLFETGDIEYCIKNINKNQAKEAERIRTYSNNGADIVSGDKPAPAYSQGGKASLDEIFDSIPDDDDNGVADPIDFDAIENQNPNSGTGF